MFVDKYRPIGYNNMYTNDKNKLYKINNLLRWGVDTPEGIYLEETIKHGAVFLGYLTQVQLTPIFVVADHNRYPTKEEFSKFSSFY